MTNSSTFMLSILQSKMIYGIKPFHFFALNAFGDDHKVDQTMDKRLTIFDGFRDETHGERERDEGEKSHEYLSILAVSSLMKLNLLRSMLLNRRHHLLDVKKHIK